MTTLLNFLKNIAIFKMLITLFICCRGAGEDGYICGVKSLTNSVGAVEKNQIFKLN